MKKLFFGMLAIVAMIATSCQQEADLGVKGGEIVSVSFELGTQSTRAYSDGLTADKLQYAVYDANGNHLSALNGTKDLVGGKTQVHLDLAQGDTYHLLFWAAAEGAPYTVDFANKTMTVDYNGAVSNDENRDAFYAYETITVNGAMTVGVELKRPFAQLNIGANDFTAMKNAGREITLSKVVVPAYTTLNLADGTVDGQTAKTFEYAAIPTEAFVVDGYQYLAMNYILVGKDQEVVDVEFHYATDNATWSNSRTVGSVPVQRNYRTNIYGKVLTNGVDVNVEINPDFDEPDYSENGYAEIDGVYVVYTGQGFADAIAAAPANAKIKLNANIDLTGVDFTPKSFNSLVFDGNNKTISGANVVGQNQAALFGKTWSFDIQNVTIANSSFSANNVDGEDAAAAFIAFLQTYSPGSKLVNCHVDNCTIGNAKYAGGLVAYKDGTYPIALENCSVKNSTISSNYTEDGGANYKGHCGGLVGYFCGEANSTIVNCVVEGNTFDVKGPRCGLFIGTAQANYAVSGEAVNNTGLSALCGTINNITDWSNVALTAYVSTKEQLAAAVNNATEDITIKFANDLEGVITLNQKRGLHFTIDGNGKNYKGGIHIFGNGGMNDRWMTIKNIHFDGTGLNGDQGCIYTTGPANGVNSYACNVTIDNCTFTGAGIAAIRQNVGGERNWTIKNCTVAAGMHSFLQVSNTNESLVVEKCKVYSKNGANLNYTAKASFTGCEFDVQGYAVRVGVNGSNSTETKVFNFTNCTLKSANDDGDAVVIIRQDAQQATLNFENTTLVGTPQISGVVDGKTTINGL